MFDSDLAGRTLPFDTDAAVAYPEIAAGRKQGGKPISQIDAQIPQSCARAARDWQLAT